ncbi:uncharacterized protein Tco025E_03970 [Trypanosoma conorhini]|uniref:VHS domain-containing protein n=1 Tax=Trypanosoma conorhini TaxID=83891 RepID=A0A422PQ77_9TRYP|nr:uncharacterized protein Tco025E_03970 [Trypanosoma conorhini]RNF19903.1 hypothetical protein Tco025E_03970 [Trypanosoma conorhini]
MNLNERLSSVLQYVRESGDPYVRLVHAAMKADRRAVPFYQMEEVREATFQSDHACEMVVRALAPSLEERATAAAAGKALYILRVLFLEGANGVRVRVARLRGSLHRLAHVQDVRRDSLEAANRDAAAALLQALDGNGEALASRGGSGGGTVEAEATSPQSYKSEFQAMHEKEQRLYRRRCEEEKRHAALTVRGRVYGTFDGGLSPDKLVEQVVVSPKKRFAPAELDSFVAAAQATGELPAVCAALDQRLQGSRQTLQDRYKVLLVVEALVRGGVREAQEYYRENSEGLRRHLTVNSAENPVKAEAAQSTARRILQALPTTPPRHAGPPQQPTSSQLDALFAGVSLQSPPAASASQQQTSAATFIEDMFGPSQGAPASPREVAPALGAFQSPMGAGFGALSGEAWQPPPGRVSSPCVSQGFAPSGGSCADSLRQTPSAPLAGVRGVSAVTAGEPAPRATPPRSAPDMPRAGDDRSDAERLRLMQEIQAQMEVTRQMLEQQQSALHSLQAGLPKK